MAAAELWLAFHWSESVRAGWIKPDLHLVKSACFAIEFFEHVNEYYDKKTIVFIFKIELGSYSMTQNKQKQSNNVPPL